MSDHDPDRDRTAEDDPVRSPVGFDPDSDSDSGSDPDAASTIGTQLDEGLTFERPPIEPERPKPENALFVVLGVLGTVVLLASAFAPGLI
ncbi:DUF7312 domain-containing protein [Halobellus rubicundus]|uniref:DUF7312 domain-containing protein n=1 Tax=Halobellus rubicundus TaxID=2996466 RepID=A0ABD5M9G6_9EURY